MTQNSGTPKLQTPGVEIVVLCPDLWGQYTHHPAAENMGYWQLTAAARCAFSWAQVIAFIQGYDPFWEQLMASDTDARIQRSGSIVSIWDNWGAISASELPGRFSWRFQLQPWCGLALCPLCLPTSLLMCLPRALQKTCKPLSTLIYFPGNWFLPQELFPGTEPVPK